MLVAESLYEDSQFPYPIKEILSDFTKIVVRYYSLPGKKNFGGIDHELLLGQSFAI